MIKSRYKISNIIVTIILSSIFLFIDYVLATDLTLPITSLNVKDFTGILFVFLLALAAIYYQLRIPTIQLDKHKIIIKSIFNKKAYQLKDIKKYKLTGKIPIKIFFITHPVEGAYIQFKNNDIIYIYDDYYSNVGEIKNLLKQGAKIPSNKNEYKNNNNKIFKINRTIKGSIFTYYSLMVVLLTLITLFFIFKMNFFINSVIFLLFLIVMTLVFGNFLYYFEFNHNKLIIKNLIFPWYEKVYNTNDIKEIIIENINYKTPDNIRIIKNNYDTKIFYAGAYMEKHWKEVIDILNNSNITVRNESLSHLEN